MNRKRYGLLGGTFDPVHNGHIAMARAFMERLLLDEVVLMPAASPPHKIKTDMAPAADRLAMCRLAASDGVTVSDWEAARGGASFTADTLAYLTETYGGQWHLLMGADMFLTVGTWWRFDEWCRSAVLCTVEREDIDLERLEQAADALRKRGAQCRVLDVRPPDVSATEIRRRIAAGQSLGELVPPGVAAYIAEKGLYRSRDTLDADAQYTDIVRHRLSPVRFAHSMAVAAEAERLARRWGADPAKARTAGILHDILKDAPPAVQLQMLEDFGILLTELEVRAPKLWHAMAGAAFCERILGLTDKDMLNAIRYHTTARAGMSLLEQTLYIADFTSADRVYDDVDTMRRLADEGKDAAIRYALDYTIKELHQKQEPVHPDTLAAWKERTHGERQ
ncbi:MAG: nicotinate (nicotinamide) nucleotide adenylyltransferase [Oscillospiraceae bacterium]|nr:nicotinate (nicotinamide) nucleotide adenylyltransferase [Oscillospiraceae bacterium]